MSGDLDFPSPLIAHWEVVFDPYSDSAPDPEALTVLPLNTTLATPEPSALLLLPLGHGMFLDPGRHSPPAAFCFEASRKPRRPGRRRVRREFRI